MPIHFGTDGWRAVISDTFTFHNLRLVGQAIADAVRSEHWLNGNTSAENVDLHKMVVGYDTRFLSDRYAIDMARVLAANGYKVILAQSDAPTPVISSPSASKGLSAGDDHRQHNASLQRCEAESCLWRFCTTEQCRGLRCI
jgi:phosphomannomutase